MSSLPADEGTVVSNRFIDVLDAPNLLAMTVTIKVLCSLRLEYDIIRVSLSVVLVVF